ncbi:MAG: inositol monophosphatase [Opitutales bacterium]|nr:inositol monophosphatase [Opitutales bacterium]
MDTSLRHRVNAGREAVKNQLRFFRQQFGAVLSEWKSDDTRVTFADFAISEKVFKELRQSFPEDHFCSEESNPSDEVIQLSSRYSWVLDPIDGTNNYALGIAFCAISLALLKDGEPVFGLIYDFSRDELIQGGPGFGIQRGNGPWRLPAAAPLEERSAVVGAHFPFPPEHLPALAPLLGRFRLRSFGSGALNLAYTALGVLDGCIDFKVKVWDIAAAVALIRTTDRQLFFMDAQPFPLREFHAEAPTIRYIAGSPAFVDWMRLNCPLPQGT